MERKWWHGKTAYQIYPKSFMDTNGDGIGDLRGVITKLDYLKELGVDIVWLSPIYCSPLADQGYDISDYYNIDPRFGTMEEMEELLAEAKKRDIHIVMDLVVNHCSDEHEWFKKACEDPDGKYGKYFYIMDHKKGEPLPCNWRSYFGGSCWEPLPGHEDKVYLHVFHKKQPDLNWENPELREEIYKMINWWLDKGLAGFRIDAIVNIKKKLPFENYPADRADGLCSIDRMLEKATGLFDFLDEMADRTFRKYDAFTAGEVFNDKEEDLPLYIGDNGCFSTMYDFAETILNRSIKGWYDMKRVTPEQYKNTVFMSQKRVHGVGFLSNIIENHDEPRGVSHYIPDGECCETSKKMLGGLSFMLEGLPFIYQGQEIGMENFTYHSVDEVDDISAKDQYQVALDAGCTPEEALAAIDHFSRDNARSPFHWDGSENAGFSSGTPWLRVNPNYPSINLAEQKDRPDSVWNFYRKLIRLRSDPAYTESVIYGETIPYLQEQHNLMAYFRRGEGQQLLVMGNFQKQPQDVVLPDTVKQLLINNLPDLSITDGTLHMEGYQFVVFEA
ncbi:MAG: alpha-glucosidase [Oscillospiraceae bacterium]|nr:alpha-glucosidase [Oscillospiraceae bacterium]